MSINIAFQFWLEVTQSGPPPGPLASKERNSAEWKTNKSHECMLIFCGSDSLLIDILPTLPHCFHVSSFASHDFSCVTHLFFILFFIINFIFCKAHAYKDATTWGFFFWKLLGLFATNWQGISPFPWAFFSCSLKRYFRLL